MIFLLMCCSSNTITFSKTYKLTVETSADRLTHCFPVGSGLGWTCYRWHSTSGQLLIWRPPLVGLVGNAFAWLNCVRISVFVVIARGLKDLVGEDDQIHQAVGESGGLVGFSVIRVKGCGAVVAQQPLYASSLSKQPGMRGYLKSSSTPFWD